MLEGAAGSELVLDGFIIQGRGLAGPRDRERNAPNGLQKVTLRHCTLVPGFGLSRAGVPLSAGCCQPHLRRARYRAGAGPLRHRSRSRAVAGGQLSDQRQRDRWRRASGGCRRSGGLEASASPCGSVWIYNTTVRGTLQASVLALGLEHAFPRRRRESSSFRAVSSGSARFLPAIPGHGSIAA